VREFQLLRLDKLSQTWYNTRTRDNKEQRENTMSTLLAISMTAITIIMGMWVWDSFKWQGWGKV
jgi:hypothetical protein